MEKDMMKPLALAEWLGLKMGKLYRMTSKGEIPCYKVGRALRFSRSEILQWLAGKRKGAA